LVDGYVQVSLSPLSALSHPFTGRWSHDRGVVSTSPTTRLRATGTARLFIKIEKVKRKPQQCQYVGEKGELVVDGMGVWSITDVVPTGRGLPERPKVAMVLNPSKMSNWGGLVALSQLGDTLAEGQQHYEPVQLWYVPVRQRELDMIDIALDDLNGNIVDLEVGTTSVVPYFKRRGAVKRGKAC